MSRDELSILYILKKYSDIEIQLLLSNLLNISLSQLLLEPEKIIAPSQARKLQAWVKLRRQGMPIAYILGFKDFYYSRFLVNKNVLIPRPESEWLVEESIELAKKIHQKTKTKIKIADIGTGSGCLAISIKLALNKIQIPCQITASDISTKALRMAEKNAKSLKTMINFRVSDLCLNLPGKFDILLANLPYIHPQEIIKLQTELEFEPKIALTDGSYNWQLGQKFLHQAKSKLFPDSYMLMEYDPEGIKWVLNPEIKKQFHWQIFPDLYGLNRYIKLKLKN